MSDVMKGQLRFSNLFYCYLMTTTPEPTVMDLTKVANATESTCPVVIVPHVPSFHTMRLIECESSSVLVDHSCLVQYDMTADYDDATS